MALALGREALGFVLTLLGAVVLVQSLLYFAPGDAIDTLPNAEELRPVLERQWRLGESLPIQIGSYLWDLAQGDLRTSLVYRPGMPVWEVIARPAWRSAQLLLAATLLATSVGVGLSFWTQGRRHLTRPAVWAVSIVPVFLLARLMIHLLNTTTWSMMQADLIARPAWFALPLEDHPLRWALAVSILAIGSGALSEIHSESEGLLRKIRASGYIEAARARGAPLWPSILRNLLPPLTVAIASRAAFFVGGLVILEKILLLNGIGAILWQAAVSRDYPLALGITLLTAAAVGLFRLGADALRLWWDPRRGATA
ncbi:MAG: ABC transporter permease [Deltaproteobacteria bacterium]|nr:MAG: ABC transporter permease [Deltaproteobacteria bacterium]